MENAWDRLPSEGDEAYKAFSIYLNLDKRSLRKTAETLQITRQTIGHWAKINAWRERAAAYDSSLVEDVRQDKVAQRQENSSRKERLANLLMDKAEEMLTTLSIKRGSFRAAVEMAELGCRLMDETLDGAKIGNEPLTINIVGVSRDDGDGARESAL